MKNSMHKMTAVAVPALLLGSTANAAVSDEQFARVMEQLKSLSARVVELEQKNTQLMANKVQIEDLSDKVAVIETKKQAPSWVDTIKLGGDFRYRYEETHLDGKDDRDRQRIRARPSLTAQLDDNIKVGFGLVTGSDDPVSGNQTLGGGGSSKGVNLDLAYAEWQASDELAIIGGKFKNVFYQPAKNQLLWDGDFRPEGMAAVYKSGDFFASAMYASLETDSNKEKTDIIGGQLGVKGSLSDGVSYLVGGGYYTIPVAGTEPNYDDTDLFGNSGYITNGPCGGNGQDDCTFAYNYDYDITQLFTELKFALGSMPVTLWADYAKNSDAKDNDVAWATGLQLGKTKAAGDWKFAATYKDIEKDAVLGALTDSDFGGGGTDTKGWKLGMGYAFNNKATLGVTYFMNEVGDAEVDYDRLHVDLKFKY